MRARGGPRALQRQLQGGRATARPTATCASSANRAAGACSAPAWSGRTSPSSCTSSPWRPTAASRSPTCRHHPRPPDALRGGGRGRARRPRARRAQPVRRDGASTSGARRRQPRGAPAAGAGPGAQAGVAQAQGAGAAAVPRHRRAARRARAAHRLPRGALPEQGRVLRLGHGDVPDPRRRVHARLPLLLGGAAGRPRAAARRGALCALDPDEPRAWPRRRERLGLRHVVVTSVTRDDLPDGGAAQFAAAIAAVRAALPDATVEVLIPDLGGDEAALRAVLAARPDVLNHNLETVPRLYPQVRPQAATTARSSCCARGRVGARAADPRRREPHGGRAAGRPADRAAGQDRPHGRPRRDARRRSTPSSPTAPRPASTWSPSASTCSPTPLPAGGAVRDAGGVRALERRGAALGLQVVAAPFVRSSYRAGEAAATPAVPRAGAARAVRRYG